VIYEKVKCHIYSFKYKIIHLKVKKINESQKEPKTLELHNESTESQIIKEKYIISFVEGVNEVPHMTTRDTF
jgi:uncharacterized protein YnzC (UPF0291/DUF896 family)